LRVRASDISWDAILIVEQDVHALVEFPVATIENHLEGNVGPVLNTRDSCLGGLNADASRRARPLEITDDELVRTGGGVEVVKGRRGGGGGQHHSDSPFCVCAVPDYQPSRERESRPVRRFRVAIAKLSLVVFVQRSAHPRESNLEMRVHDGHSRKRGSQNGPSQFHVTSN